jgi:3-hydroxyacyl-CoA dehydrogenase
MKTAVIGAGLIGQAWAIVFARGGHNVHLWDGDEAALRRSVPLIAAQINKLQDKQLLSDAVGVMARIQPTTNLERALGGAVYVQENLPEELSLKKEIFARLDQLSETRAILASSTSSIPASAFTEGLFRRHRCLVAHPVNPPYLIPVVELCGTPWTHEDAIESARSILMAVGQKPVVVRQELEGFVLNRLQGALLREAFRLVKSGCITVEDLDITVKEGLGLRWAFMGPFETIDLNSPGGLLEYCQRYGDMYQSIARTQTDTEAWDSELLASIEAERRAILPKSDLLKRRTWRDERLMELMLHKQSISDD